MLSFFLPILYFFLRIIYMDYSQLNTTCYWCFLYGHQSHHITSFGQLNNNQLTGPIPRELVGISSLKVIDVSKNNLCGTIPTSGPFEHIPLNKLMSMASESSPISVADNEHEDCYVKDGKAKSKVWMHMVKLPTEDKDILKAQCKYCKEIFSAASKNGTSHIWRHLKRCSKRFHHDIRNYTISTETTTSGSTSLHLKNPKFDQEEVRRAICMFIVAGAHPFRTCEEPGFKYMVSVMCPQYKTMSRHTIRRDALKYYMDEMKVVKEELAQAPGRICLTSDN
ncbi:zinc finger BED domain-containing protein RICESLEEPER 4-like isoform X2 [Phoenix dactylifera]|uniref:Zinc finger BED domain-containing protein RICESLEEPER 4-like isoform X2 n=1 Tax=Phoenix dactylifera TaxID=42345 RepID=A0A8B8ZIK7_PHODC|nr:zinc finger BED domain-containing protein RICESLEEPER 4-like isoform X2 [Phoenix dactylifera]